MCFTSTGIVCKIEYKNLLRIVFANDFPNKHQKFCKSYKTVLHREKLTLLTLFITLHAKNIYIEKRSIYSAVILSAKFIY